MCIISVCVCMYVLKCSQCSVNVFVCFGWPLTKNLFPSISPPVSSSPGVFFSIQSGRIFFFLINLILLKINKVESYLNTLNGDLKYEQEEKGGEVKTMLPCDWQADLCSLPFLCLVGAFHYGNWAIHVCVPAGEWNFLVRVLAQSEEECWCEIEERNREIKRHQRATARSF